MLKKMRNKIKKTGWKNFDNFYLAKHKYTKQIEKLPIDSNAILIESQHGKEMDGNVFYLIKELTTNPQYKGFNIYLSAVARRYVFLRKN